MSALDGHGNPLSAATPADIAAINDFVSGFLGYRPGMVRILAAAETLAHPLVHIYAAATHMFAEAPGAARAARPYLARAAARPMHPREAAAHAAVTAWADDRPADALRLHAATVVEHPRDLAAVKLAQYHAFNHGDFPATLRVALAALPYAAEIAAAHGLAAFGYEQCHLIDEADAAARTALALDPAEPWAHHALAHVYLTRGDIAGGAAFMDSVAPGWIDLNSFMHTHLHWHRALFDLAAGDTAAALARYDAEVWGREPGYSQDQIGAVSLLARIELAGGDVGPRWAALAPYLEARAEDVTLPFLALQYLLGLVRAGSPAAATLMAAIEARAAEKRHDRGWADAALPAARAMIAGARGDHAAAAHGFAHASAHMLAVGGSHAQRDLFAQLHLEATLRAGDDIAAQQMLELRRAATPGDVPANRALAAVYARLGLPREAEAAARRAGFHARAAALHRAA